MLYLICMIHYHTIIYYHTIYVTLLLRRNFWYILAGFHFLKSFHQNLSSPKISFQPLKAQKVKNCYFISIFYNSALLFCFIAALNNQSPKSLFSLTPNIEHTKFKISIFITVCLSQSFLKTHCSIPLHFSIIEKNKSVL